MNSTIAKVFLMELNAEVAATRKCLERITESTFSFKPHEKSMAMGYLSVIVAEVPKWITTMVEIGEIDFGTWKKYELTTVADLVRYFDENVEDARKALSSMSDDELEKMFYLKMNGTTLMSDPKKNSISSTLNHWVHHRGQLTVYMRLNDIPVPSIYGPSADDKTF